MSQFDKSNKATAIREDDHGDIQIGSDVIGDIIRIAIADSREFENRITLYTRAHITDGIPVIGRKKKDDSSSVVIVRDDEDGSVEINVDIRIVFGEDMYDLAIRLRNHIKHTVEKMTRVEVKKINVKIVGIFMSEKQLEERDADSDELKRILSIEESEED